MSDTPVDRATVGVFHQVVEPGLELSPDGASLYALNRVWTSLVTAMVGMSDAQFDRADRQARALAGASKTNLGAFVLERVQDILTDITDFRWKRWAAREELEGRNPYRVWSPATE